MNSALAVDISGSMGGAKMKAAKIGLTMLCEALQNIARVKIVLFTGKYNAFNILVKDFDDPINVKNMDKIGRHYKYNLTPDGVAIKHEASKLKEDTAIIVLSDGQPYADGDYGLYNSAPDIKDVRKIYKVYCFSIDAQGQYLKVLYGDNYVLAKSKNTTDLGEKMVKLCQHIARAFYR